MLDLLKKIYSKGCNNFYKLVANNLRDEKRMFIVTTNPEIMTMSEKSKSIKKMLLDNNVTLIPDGIGVVKAANMLGFKISERITGIDLASQLLKMANENKYKVALLGAKKEVLDALVNRIREDYSNINLVAYENGYNTNKDSFFKKIIKYKPDIVLVALGMPNQEEIIYRHLNDFQKGIFVGVGGSFDVLSGSKKRAPKLFIKTNTEWLYRIIREPKRIKRFYQNNIKFMFKMKKLKKRYK